MTTPKVYVQFDEDFKSFKKGFSVSLEGNLILISGVNGSGKSHLLEKMKSSWLKTEGEDIIKERILHKSFRDILSISEITSEAPVDFSEVITIICSIYKQIQDNKPILRGPTGNFDDAPKWNWEWPDGQRTIEGVIHSYSDPSRIVDKKIGGYGKALRKIFQEIGDHDISKIDLITKLETVNLNEIWQPDDFFSEKAISDLFYAYAEKRDTFMRDNEGVKSKGVYEDKNAPPWLRLNDLFTGLDLSYKFAADYSISGGKISGGISLLNKENSPITFSLKDFSDGEKAIFLLALASLRSEYLSGSLKVLLLDEYDAILNPSLVRVFYEMLEEFFIKKGVVVIIVTHSTATISLAPKKTDYAVRHYEMNKPGVGEERITDITDYYFDELKVAHENFYNSNKEKREEIRKYLEEGKNILFVEGKTDKSIIETALGKLNVPLDIVTIDLEGADNAGKYFNYIKKYLKQASSESKAIFLFDNDMKGVEARGRLRFKKDSQSSSTDISKDKNFEIYSLVLPIPEFRKNYVGDKVQFMSIEHLFEDNLIGDCCKEESIIGEIKLLIPQEKKKKIFAQNVKKFKKDEFKEFEKIFNLVLTIVTPLD